MNKTILALVLAGASLTNTSVFAQSVEFDIHIGNVPPPAIPPPPPLVFERPPQMVFMDGPRVYGAVGVPYDLFYYDNFYFYFHNGNWYRSAYYRGPWVYAEPRGIPPGLYRHRIEELREYRRHAWEAPRERHQRFRERHFRPEEPEERHHREMR